MFLVLCSSPWRTQFLNFISSYVLFFSHTKSISVEIVSDQLMLKPYCIRIRYIATAGEKYVCSADSGDYDTTDRRHFKYALFWFCSCLKVRSLHRSLKLKLISCSINCCTRRCEHNDSDGCGAARSAGALGLRYLWRAKSAFADAHGAQTCRVRVPQRARSRTPAARLWASHCAATHVFIENIHFINIFE